MATGDKAIEAGLDLVAASDDAKLGFDEINLTRDMLAEHMIDGGHHISKITGIKVSKGSEGNAVVQRGSDGRFAIPDGFNADHPVSKGQFDYSIASLSQRLTNLGG